MFSDNYEELEGDNVSKPKPNVGAEETSVTVEQPTTSVAATESTAPTTERLGTTPSFAEESKES